MISSSWAGLTQASAADYEEQLVGSKCAFANNSFHSADIYLSTTTRFLVLRAWKEGVFGWRQALHTEDSTQRALLFHGRYTGSMRILSLAFNVRRETTLSTDRSHTSTFQVYPCVIHAGALRHFPVGTMTSTRLDLADRLLPSCPSALCVSSVG